MDTEQSPVCYLTTVGRRSGGLHRIEIWFLPASEGVYLLSGNGRAADWVMNLVVEPRVTLELPGLSSATYLATVHEDGHESGRWIRQEMDRRYYGWQVGQPLSGWVEAATIVELQPLGAGS